MYSDLLLKITRESPGGYRRVQGGYKAGKKVQCDHRHSVGISGRFCASILLGRSAQTSSFLQVLLPIGLFCLDTSGFLVKITVQVISSSCRGGRECHWSVSF